MMINLGKHTIEITHPDKILFGKSGLTKKDMVDYYMAVAPIMMPYIEDRLIAMQRFPQGIGKDIFFQKNAGDYFPTWIKRIPVTRKDGGTVEYIAIEKPATLLYLANQICVPHLWLSKVDNIQKPDHLIFDLDPAGGLAFTAIQDVARKLKSILDDLGLPSFCMLTGSRGAHIIVPLKRIHSFDETRIFAYDIAQLLTHTFPHLTTVDMHKTTRGKRVFIDWLRNGFGATAVAPYAVRALENAPVAMPVTWKELLSDGMSSQKYTITNAMERIDAVGDMWQDMAQSAVSLSKARKKLDKIMSSWRT